MFRISAFLLLLSFSAVILPQAPLPTADTTLFAGSGKCIACHISNKAGVLMTYGESLTPTNHWKSSMMANASKDPFWRAVVSEETKKFPELAKMIETTCTRCHSPMGNAQSKYEGKEHFSLAEVKENSLWNDGVSCT